MAMRDRLIGVTATQTRLAEELIESEPWDLFLMVYGTTHRAGHHLWSDTGVAGSVPQHSERSSTRRCSASMPPATKGWGGFSPRSTRRHY